MHDDRERTAALRATGGSAGQRSETDLKVWAGASPSGGVQLGCGSVKAVVEAVAAGGADALAVAGADAPNWIPVAGAPSLLVAGGTFLTSWDEPTDGWLNFNPLCAMARNTGTVVI